LTSAIDAAYVQGVNTADSHRLDPRFARIVADPASLKVLRLLAASPCLSQRDVASLVGVSLGKANYCLRALIAKGFVKAENYRKSRNKLAYLYCLTPSGIAAKADLTRQFLARKVREYEALRDEIEGLERESGLVAHVEYGVEQRQQGTTRALAFRPL
jgi:EPS-associated MarR family transcriptional regulator